MTNKGDMVLIIDGGILDYDGLLDALLNNGYTVTMDKVGACLYLKYEMKSDEPQTFTAEGIVFAKMDEPNSSEIPNNCERSE